jgi:hypothetical protein
MHMPNTSWSCVPLLRPWKSVSNAAGAEVSKAVCGGTVLWCRQVTDSVRAEAAESGAWAPLTPSRLPNALDCPGVLARRDLGPNGRRPWFLTVESGRPELVALVNCHQLALLLLALPAGALADVLDCRRMLIVVQTGPAVVAVALARSGGCGIRTREGMHPTRFPIQQTEVHAGSPLLVPPCGAPDHTPENADERGQLRPN